LFLAQNQVNVDIADIIRRGYLDLLF